MMRKTAEELIAFLVEKHGWLVSEAEAYVSDMPDWMQRATLKLWLDTKITVE